MKLQRAGINPAMIELIVVILFFALSSCIVVQVLIEADVITTRSARRSEAMLSLTQWGETLKQAPGDAGTYQNGHLELSREAGEMTLDAQIAREESGEAGEYYILELTARSGDETLYTLHMEQFIAREGMP